MPVFGTMSACAPTRIHAYTQQMPQLSHTPARTRSSHKRARSAGHQVRLLQRPLPLLVRAFRVHLPRCLRTILSSEHARYHTRIARDRTRQEHVVQKQIYHSNPKDYKHAHPPAPSCAPPPPRLPPGHTHDHPSQPPSPRLPRSGERQSHPLIPSARALALAPCFRYVPARPPSLRRTAPPASNPALWQTLGACRAARGCSHAE